DQSRSFDTPLQATMAIATTITGGGEPERVVGRRMTAGLLPMLGVGPAAGRGFSPDDDRAGAAPVAMVSYGLWQRRWGGASDAIGKTVDLDAVPYTIIGVLPRGFEILAPADVYLALHTIAPTLPNDRTWHPGIIALGRLKPGVPIRQARDEMVGIARHLEQEYPANNTGFSADVVGLQDQLVQNVRPALWILLGAVSFVLLIACANVANLLLARAASRSREVAIRTSMGASRGRVVRQLLTESILLSLAGGGLGLLMAWASLGALLQLSAGALPPGFTVSLDPAVLTFTFAVAVGTGLVFGLAPALRTTRLDLRATLNEGSRGSTGGPRAQRVRGVLMTTEIALAVLLLVGAGLLLKSFARLQDVSPGFQPDHLFVADLPLSTTTYARPEQRSAFFDRLIDRARTLPGVRAAAAATFLPVSGGGGLLHFNIAGQAPKGPADYTAAGYRAVSEGYFETLNVPLLKGRRLTRSDDEKGPPVVLINQSMAKVYFPNQDPIGQRVQLGATPSTDFPSMEIVGVVGDVIQGLGLDPKAEMYLPYRQADRAPLSVFQMSLVVRTAGDPHLMAGAVRGAVAELNPNQPVVRPRTMDDNMAASVSQPRFRTWLIGIFAGLALLIASVGIYGVMSYSVAQRTSEIGIRVTLGAQRSDIARVIVGESLRYTLVGVVLGLAGGLVLSRLLKTFLFGVSTSDPLTFAGVAILLIVVAVIASLIPARRAIRVDPIVALRYE
ncbi:MAG TPA: ABC transporter permease, partial [Gemmatimonadales bacterium]